MNFKIDFINIAHNIFYHYHSINLSIFPTLIKIIGDFEKLYSSNKNQKDEIHKLLRD